MNQAVPSSGQNPSLCSQLLYLQLAAAGVASKEADHAASHLGKAVGITTLLKGTAFHASNRRSYLPLDWCADHRVSQVSVDHVACLCTHREIGSRICQQGRNLPPVFVLP